MDLKQLIKHCNNSSHRTFPLKAGYLEDPFAYRDQASDPKTQNQKGALLNAAEGLLALFQGIWGDITTKPFNRVKDF